MSESKLPKQLIWAVVALCVLPIVLNLLGVDFGLTRQPFDLSAAQEMSPAEFDDALHHAVSGSHLHSLLEWTAFCIAVFTVLLAFGHFKVTGDVITPVIGMALFCAGAMDAFHTLAADRLIEAVADNTYLIPFTWAISRLFNALILLGGVGLFLLGRRRKGWGNLRFVLTMSALFGVLAYAIIHYSATSAVLPQTLYPASVITRPFDVAPLILYAVAGLIVFPMFYRKEGSIFAHALIISMIPQVVTQLHMSFGSTALFDNHFNIAHAIKILAYAVPFVGLVFAYAQAYRQEERTIVQMREAKRMVEERTGELAKSEIRYRDLFDNAGDLIQSVSARGHFEFVNPRWLAVLGYSVEEVPRLHFFDIIHRDEREHCRTIFGELAQGKSFDQIETVFLTKDGREVIVQGSISPLFVEGRFVATRGFFQDITETRRMQEALRESKARSEAILSAMPDMFYVINREGVFLDFRAAAENRPYVPPEKFLGRRVPEILPPDVAGQCMAAAERAVETGEIQVFEYQLPYEDGPRDFEARFVAGREDEIVVIVRNITEEKRAEEESRRRTAAAQLLDRVVAAASNEASSVDEAMQVSLQEVCAFTGWPVGHVYYPAPDGSGVLRPAKLWHFDEPEKFHVFRRVTERTSFALGEGLPGRVLKTGTPAWIIDVTKDPNFSRAKQAEDIGVRAGFCFPVRAGSEVKAVLEFFSPEAAEPDPFLLTTMAQVGTQLGHVVERKEAEEALRESERQYRDMVENVSELICTHDREGRLLSANRATVKAVGYEREDELVGRLVSDLMEPKAARLFPAYLETVLSQGRARGLMVVRTRAGDERIWEYDNTLRQDAPPGLVVRGVARDVTERVRAEAALRRSEAKFRRLMEDAPNAILLATLDGRIIQANRSVQKLFGYAPEELVGEDVELLVPDRFRSAHTGHREKYAAAPRSRPMGPQMELYGRRKDGSEFPVEVSLGAFDTQDGKLVAATVVDVTERQAMEKMKDEFVSMVSHELRTPLTSIRGALGLMAGGVVGKFSDKARRMMEIAITNTDRLVRLINDILDLERMKSARVEMEKQYIQVDSIMSQAAEVMHAMAQKAGVELELSSPSEHLWADPDRLLQTLTNLLSNAIKFSEKGGKVWLIAERSGGDMLFRVRDQGRGIPPEQVDRIFERFQQVDASDSRERGGTGLGLAICRSIVEQHGGRIWAESRPGEGSTFFFTLPAPKGEEESKAVAVTRRVS